MKNKTTKFLINFLLITVGTVIYSFSIAMFLDPYNMAPGGVTGLGMILAHFTHLKTGTAIYMLQIPIMIFGLIKFGWKIMGLTLYVTTLSSAIMNGITTYILPVTGVPTDGDMIMSALVGGALLGTGMALIFKNGATTGGIDVIVKALRQKFPYLKTGSMFLMCDSFIIFLSMLAFGNVKVGLYAIIAIVTNNTILDFFLYKNDGAKLLYVITDKAEAVADRVMKEVDIGVTFIEGEGAYTGEKKKIVMIVAKPVVYPKIRVIVREEDKNAFFIVTGASDVFGYGYKDHFMQEL